MSKEIVYIAQTKLANGEWGSWICPTFEEAEKAILDKRSTLSETQNEKVEFRIVKHEIVESDVTGDMKVSHCQLGHKFARLSSHPKNGNVYYCPRCMLGTLELAKGEAVRCRLAVLASEKTLDDTQKKLARLTEVLCMFARSADKTVSTEAFAALEKYEEDYDVI